MGDSRWYAEEGLQAAGIHDFDEAVEACAVLQGANAAASGAEYKLDDLICFLCLSQHKEAVSDPGMPAPARPVTLEEDLGLVCAFPEPEDNAVQPLKARRWKVDALQPLAQPTLRPVASFALPLASVQENLLLWLPIASAIPLVQCCRSLHGGGLCIALRIEGGYRGVADSVANIAFHPKRYVALVGAGLSKSTILRAVACAWDWLEKCPRVFLDESLLPLALLRLSIKFEVDKDHVGAALELIGQLDEKPALLSFEPRLVEALWGGLPDGEGCPSQPLAR